MGETQANVRDTDKCEHVAFNSRIAKHKPFTLFEVKNMIITR